MWKWVRALLIILLCKGTTRAGLGIRALTVSLVCVGTWNPTWTPPGQGTVNGMDVFALLCHPTEPKPVHILQLGMLEYNGDEWLACSNIKVTTVRPKCRWDWTHNSRLGAQDHINLDTPSSYIVHTYTYMYIHASARPNYRGKKLIINGCWNFIV